MSKATCAACRHQIDAAARLCPYCGADPQTGHKVDTRAILDEVFHPREVSTTEGVMQFARQRQGVVITVAAFAALLILGALHQFAVRRNERAVNAGPAVPLTELTDVSNQPAETKQLPMPEMQFQFTGRPQSMRTFVVEPGAVTPPEVIAEQQQQQQGPQQQPQQPAAPAPKPQPQ